VIAVATTVPLDCVIPFTCTLRPLLSDPQDPLSYVVELSAVTGWDAAVKVIAGHLPARLATVPSNSIGVPVTGAGDDDAVLVTVTGVVHIADCLALSEAVQVTVVVPTANSEPDAGEQLLVIGAVPPLTVGASKVTFTGLPLCDTVDGIVGQLMASGAAVTAGAVTRTALLHEADSESASFAVQASGVTPTGNNDPDAGVQPTVIGAVPPLTVALNVTTTGLPSGEAALGAGHVMTGGALVPTIADTSCENELSRPAESYACTAK